MASKHALDFPHFHVEFPKRFWGPLDGVSSENLPPNLGGFIGLFVPYLAMNPLQELFGSGRRKKIHISAQDIRRNRRWLEGKWDG